MADVPVKALNMLGQELKRRREALGLSLTEIAESTRIGTRFLKAIEADEFGVLPEGIYARSFVKAFARYVKMDEDEAVSLFQQQTGAEAAVGDPDVPPLDDAEPFVFKEPSAGFWPAAIVAGLLAVVFIGGAYAVWRYSQQPAAVAPVTKPSQNPKAEPNPEPAAAPGGSPVSIQPEVVDGEIRVTLKALDTCWVKYTADNGEPVQKELQIGEEAMIRATESVDLSIGNTRAIALQINGQNARFPDNTGIVLRRLTITPETAKDLLIN